MKIVVLDGHPLNPGDLSWDALRRLGECSLFDRTKPEDVVERCTGAEIVLANKTRLDRACIEKLPSLRYVGVLATGYNNIDVEAAARKGIVVTNVPSYATESVAQMVFGHVLNLMSGIGYHTDAVRNGKWSSSRDWSFWETNLVELAGLTLGIVGYGRIGRAVGRLGLAFGMRVIAYEPVRADEVPPEGVVFLDLDELFRQSDIVTLHCPLTESTRGLVNRDRLGLMKSSAILINTSRGGLVDEHALAEALTAKRIAGAGIDVLAVEPPSASNVLLHAPNCYITPHIAWATHAARKRLLDIAVSNLAAFLAGRPENVVS